jgi:hypothetical protein
MRAIAWTRHDRHGSDPAHSPDWFVLQKWLDDITVLVGHALKDLVVRWHPRELVFLTQLGLESQEFVPAGHFT